MYADKSLQEDKAFMASLRVKEEKAFFTWEKLSIVGVISVPILLIYFDKKYLNRRKKERVKTSKLLWIALIIIVLFALYLVDTFFLVFNSYSS